MEVVREDKKITKDNIKIDDVMVQSAMIMVNAVADAEREGATMSFEGILKNESYNVDVIIKKVKK